MPSLLAQAAGPGSNPITRACTPSGALSRKVQTLFRPTSTSRSSDDVRNVPSAPAWRWWHCDGRNNGSQSAAVPLGTKTMPRSQGAPPRAVLSRPRVILSRMPTRPSAAACSAVVRTPSASSASSDARCDAAPDAAAATAAAATTTTTKLEGCIAIPQQFLSQPFSFESLIEPFGGPTLSHECTCRLQITARSYSACPGRARRPTSTRTRARR